MSTPAYQVLVVEAGQTVADPQYMNPGIFTTVKIGEGWMSDEAFLASFSRLVILEANPHEGFGFATVVGQFFTGKIDVVVSDDPVTVLEIGHALAGNLALDFRDGPNDSREISVYQNRPKRTGSHESTFGATADDELNPIQLAILRVLMRWAKSLERFVFGFFVYIFAVSYLIFRGISLSSLNFWNVAAAAIVLVISSIFFRALWKELGTNSGSEQQEQATVSALPLQ